MTTTNLFVELIVIGVGAVVWLSLLFMSVFGFNDLVFQPVVSPVAVVLVLSITYVLGIVTDRIADFVFESLFGAKLRRQWFERLEDYYQARMELFENQKIASQLLEYGRSRLRICRGWALNSFLIAVGLNIFLAKSPFDAVTRMRIAGIGTPMLLLFAVGAWYSWGRIQKTEYSKIAYMRTAVRK